MKKTVLLFTISLSMLLPSLTFVQEIEIEPIMGYGSIRGTIVDTNQTPIGGATVSYVGTDDYYRQGSGYVTSDSTTGEYDTKELWPGQYRLSAFKKG